MTLTDEQYAEVLAAVKRRDVGVLAGYLHVSRWCDGSTACAVTSEPHGHWRGGYHVDAGEVMRRLLDENERLRAENERLTEEIKRLRGAFFTIMGLCDSECSCAAGIIAKRALDGKDKP